MKKKVQFTQKKQKEIEVFFNEGILTFDLNPSIASFIQKSVEIPVMCDFDSQGNLIRLHMDLTENAENGTTPMGDLLLSLPVELSA